MQFGNIWFDSDCLLPAPALGDRVSWLKRPLSLVEVTSTLECDDAFLSSHSLKATTLSWASKAEVPREQRRVLGRHSSAAQCCGFILQSRRHKCGSCEFITESHSVDQGKDILSRRYKGKLFPKQLCQPCRLGTPGMTAGYTWNDSSSAGRGRLLEPEQPQLGEAEVSSESSCALLPFGKSAEVIELSSDSECDSSENASLDSTTDQDDGIDLDPDDSGDDAPAGSQDRFWTTLWPGMTRQRSFMSAVKVTISTHLQWSVNIEWLRCATA